MNPRSNRTFFYIRNMNEIKQLKMNLKVNYLKPASLMKNTATIICLLLLFSACENKNSKTKKNQFSHFYSRLLGHSEAIPYVSPDMLFCKFSSHYSIF